MSWNSTTTGSFSGFDAWLKDAHDGVLTIETPLLQRQVEISKIGYEDLVFEAGGLSRRMRLFRLPTQNKHCHIRLERSVPLRSGEDNPIYVRVTQEDGHRSWSSPIYFVTP